jgi:hypothetical protein
MDETIDILHHLLQGLLHPNKHEPIKMIRDTLTDGQRRN